MSVVILIAGIVCGLYIGQRWEASNKLQNNPEVVEPGLELKENVAYITIRPTA
jgi:uncharacterized protein YneF (UPF0154 family)